MRLFYAPLPKCDHFEWLTVKMPDGLQKSLKKNLTIDNTVYRMGNMSVQK